MDRKAVEQGKTDLAACIEMIADHVERAYQFSPNSYTWDAVMAVHAALLGDAERIKALGKCAYAETEIEKETVE